MSNHTPGPWEVYERGDFRPEVISESQTHDEVAELYWLAGRDAETLANAHLIAAAPDLLAACEAYIAAEDGTDLMTAFVGMTRARALIDRAIAKAKGNDDA